MSSTDTLLEERGKTHGEYSEHAAVTQGIMRVLMTGCRWGDLSDIQLETLHMTAHKMGRIVTGDPNHPDHWADIAGYARLVEQRLPAGKAPPERVLDITTRTVSEVPASPHTYMLTSDELRGLTEDLRWFWQPNGATMWALRQLIDRPPPPQLHAWYKHLAGEYWMIDRSRLTKEALERLPRYDLTLKDEEFLTRPAGTQALYKQVQGVWLLRPDLRELWGRK